MTALSLFDGMSCAQIAMKKAGWKCDQYYASEIDKYAMRVTQANFPDTIQIGDCTKIDIDALPKIDYLFAGSPCQGFSKAGKGLNFEDPRSKLFWVFVDVLNKLKAKNPDLIWLLENVDMVQEWGDIISKAVGIGPVKINSALVSAQNRVRLYWTNIGVIKDMFGHLVPGISQPKDRGIVLKDILEEEVDEKYYISDIAIKRMQSRKYSQVKYNPDKTGTLNAKNNSGQLSSDSGTTLIVHSGYARTGGKKQGGTGPLSREDGKTYCLDSNPQNNKLEMVGGVINLSEFKANKANKANNIDGNYFKGNDNHGQRTVIQVNPSLESGGAQPFAQNRIYDEKGLMPALRSELSGRNNVKTIIQVDSIYANNGDAGRVYSEDGKGRTLKGDAGGGAAKMGMVETKTRIRRLTPVECERLQGVPDNYTAHVSDSQRYRMLGNGWQIDTIIHILKAL